jgi:hypothetical protein
MDKIMIPQESSSDAIDLSQSNPNGDDMTHELGIRVERRGAGSLQGATSDGSPSMSRIRKNRREEKIPFS